MKLLVNIFIFLYLGPIYFALGFLLGCVAYAFEHKQIHEEYSKNIQNEMQLVGVPCEPQESWKIVLDFLFNNILGWPGMFIERVGNFVEERRSKKADKK